jgi:hypothetical protein
LVMHQGNQGGDHQRGAQAGLLPRNGRHLVAKAFASAGRHQNQRIAACNDVFDDGLLRPPKSLVAEYVVKNLQMGH